MYVSIYAFVSQHLKTELLPWIANETNARDIAAELVSPHLNLVQPDLTGRCVDRAST